MKRAEIIAEARTLIGTPFLHQGRNSMGIDCVGMVQKVGDKFGCQYEDLTGYARCPTDIKFLRHLRKHLKSAPILGNKLGQVGVFRQSIFPCHVGIFSEIGGVLHLINSRADRKRVVEEPYQDNEFYLVELLSFPGLED